MAGQALSSRLCSHAVVFLFLLGTFCVDSLMAAADAAEEEPILLGAVSRAEIEAAMPDWVAAEVVARPDVDAAGAMLTALEGAEVTVFFGTWCSDSGRELPRLWRALDELGVLGPEEIRYIGVSRDKTEPRSWVADQDLRLIPTFIVRRGGTESGRIVESSPDGIERDLLALLRGDKSGLITDSEDLESAGGER